MISPVTHLLICRMNIALENAKPMKKNQINLLKKQQREFHLH